MYAIIQTGSKQYRVSQGDVIEVEKLVADAGQQVIFDQVYMIGGETPKIGTPTVAKARVTGEVVEQGKGPKLISFKFKRRKGYRRKIGHRQPLTTVKIKSIEV